jgi:Lrp/AsnC family transcriptional regulator
MGNYPMADGNFRVDAIDKSLLAKLQKDVSPSIETIAEAVNLSRNACWRRIKQLEESGIIHSRVVLLDPAKIGLHLDAFIAISTSTHAPDWLASFAKAIQDIPEIIGAYRITGSTDYLLHAVLPDIAGYDRLYKKLISRIPLTDVSASFVMEKIKETNVLPLAYAETGKA